jgi:RNA polymerase sigma-70 factor (ECF subfamily)
VCCLNNPNDLALRASNGDRPSFDTLVQLYNKRLIAIARYYVQEEASDIVQQVWLKMWQKPECLREVKNIEAWLFQVTRYQCLEYLRNKSRKKNKVTTLSFDENYELIDALISSDDGPEKTVLKEEAIKALKKYISELAEIYALPIALYYLEGFSIAEISRHLDLPVSTIKWRLYSGRQLLKKIIMKGGFFL